MATINETIDAIEACRTCGIYYMTTSNYLKPLFQSPVEQPEMMLIRLELAQWKVEVGEHDGYPQYVCSSCIHEFQKVFKFRSSCVETQEQFRHFYSIREENRANIKIKTELKDPDEEKPLCDFIYVDELSDTEYDGATPFNIPHVPIKEELIEAATIPMEESNESINVVAAAASVVKHNAPSSAAAEAVATAPVAIQQSQIIVQNDSSLTNTSSASANVSSMLQEAQIECKLCQHLSPNRDEHKLHMQRAHEIRDMECHICGKKFKNSTPARLKFHMKWHNISKHVKCTQCGFVCNSKEALQEHKRANHVKINCKICRKGIFAKKMKAHLREHEVLTKYPCEYCTEAFSSDNEREAHIWQIHASEDNNETPTTSNQAVVQEAQETELTAEEEDELLRDDEPELQEDVNFKFFCAHCDEKFIQQIDLEIHVKQEHRLQKQISATGEVETANINHDLINAINMPPPPPITPHEEHTTALAVYHNYDNENHSNELHEPELHNDNNDEQSFEDIPTENYDTHFMHSENLTKQQENVENQHYKDIEREQDKSQSLTHESQHELQPSQSDSSDQSTVTTESDDEIQQEETTKTYFSTSSFNDNLHPFACAKCTQTFATVEQLRLHHEQHLAEINPVIQTSSRAKFKCQFCHKTFDLKFSLNRHIKKHKHAPV